MEDRWKIDENQDPTPLDFVKNRWRLSEIRGNDIKLCVIVKRLGGYIKKLEKIRLNYL